MTRSPFIRSVVGLIRSAIIGQRKPLKRTTWIKCGPPALTRGNLQRKTPIKQRSPEKALDDARWASIKVAFRASGTPCQWPGCREPFHDLHHWRSKGRGGKSSMDNAVPLCRTHHDHVHSHPLEAERLGLLESGHTFVTQGEAHAPSQRGGAK